MVDQLVRSLIVPAIAVAVALAIRLIFLTPLLGNHGPVITFFLAVVFSVVFGGFTGGIVATILSALVAAYFFFEPTRSFALASPSSIILLAYFVMTGLVVSVIGELLIRSRAREAARADEISAEREKLRISLSTIGEAVITVDTDSRVTFLNDTAEALTGWSRQEAVGATLQDIFRLVDPAIREPNPDPLSLAADRSGVERPGLPILVSRDGRECTIKVSSCPIRNECGTVSGTMLVFRDETGRLRAEAALRSGEERLRLATSAADLGIWDYDPGSEHVTCDERARRHLELSESAEVGFEDLFGGLHPDDRRRAEQAVRAVLAGERIGIHGEYRTASAGAERWVEVKGKALRGSPDEPVRLIGTVADITARKRSEEMLREADRRKTEFLATLSHELRNPLAPIRTGLHIMKLIRSEEERSRTRDMMERQVLHMVRLIDELLDISRITLGRIELKKEHVDLRDILKTAIDASRPFIDSREHSLSFELPDEPLIVDADPTRIVQVFNNLLNNAAKYTPCHGTIQVSVESSDERVSVHIRDSGIGISHEMLAYIFEPFNQAPRDPGTESSGLGIGLTLARRLTEMHGGTVEAESDGIGTGSTFTVELPLDVASRPAATCPQANGSTEPNGAGANAFPLKILIVDDNPDAAASLTMLLNLYGHETRKVHSGVDALRESAEFLPDLILLDIGLPGLDGHEVARRIRSRVDLKQPYIVALTGWGSDEDQRQSRQAGFDDHLTKPVHSTTVMRILDRITAELSGTP
jgi:PAS domain S-box-containing protein